MILPDLLSVCAMNPVSTYLEQRHFGCIPSLNYETFVLGKKINLSDFITEGDSRKIRIEIKKVDLATYYDVDKKTLNKWVKAFCPLAFYEQWIKRNKKFVTEEDFDVLIEHLGFSFLLTNASKKWIAIAAKQKQTAIKILMQDPEIQVMDFKIYKTNGKYPPIIAEKLFRIIEEELN